MVRVSKYEISFGPYHEETAEADNTSPSRLGLMMSNALLRT